MNPLCDPHRNVVRPVPSKGERERPPDPTHPNAGNFYLTRDGLRDAQRFVATGEKPHFNALEIQYLPQKIDGETEHLFLAFLNGKVVGSCTARIWDDKSCGVRRLFVTPANRGMGIATQLLTAVEILARQERATHLELSCNRGNVNARQFWIRRKFIDDPERDAQPDPLRFICMIKPL